MDIGVCGSPEGIARTPGLDYVEGTVGDLLCPREDEKAFAARRKSLAALAVPVRAANCFLPGDLKSTGPDVCPEALDAYVATALDRAGRLGLAVIVFGSGGSRRVPDGWPAGTARQQMIEHLKRWGPLAGRAGVTIALEPLNRGECNIVNSVGEGAALVREVDCPSIRLLADTYHMARDGDPPEAIRRAAGLIAHVHCAEGDGRGPLGTVGEDQRPYFQAIKDIGYEGRVSIEARWEDQATQLPDAVAELRRQIDEA